MSDYIHNPKSINYWVKTKLSRDDLAEWLIEAISNIQIIDSKRGIVNFSGSIHYDLNGWSEKSEKYFE